MLRNHHLNSLSFYPYIAAVHIRQPTLFVFLFCPLSPILNNNSSSLYYQLVWSNRVASLNPMCLAKLKGLRDTSEVNGLQDKEVSCQRRSTRSSCRSHIIQPDPLSLFLFVSPGMNSLSITHSFKTALSNSLGTIKSRWRRNGVMHFITEPQKARVIL